MRIFGVFTAITVSLFVLCKSSTFTGDATAANRYSRIISFAPSITETLFALGLGENVVGVTRYCNYPPEVDKIPKLGGYLDPNYETILSLKPDLVLLLKEHIKVIDFLKHNNIHYEIIDNENVSAILNSFLQIGKLCLRQRRADSLVALFNAEKRAPLTINEKRPRILFCIGRDNTGSGKIVQLYAAGPKSFYSQLINYAGGENAFTDSLGTYPLITAEGIFRISPDIVIDLMAPISHTDISIVKKDWDCLNSVPAVKNGLVFCPDKDFMTIPGPRIRLILKEINTAVVEYYSKSRNTVSGNRSPLPEAKK